MKDSTPQETLELQRWMTVCFIAGVIGVLILSFMNFRYHQDVNTEALKAGLVQQAVAYNDPIWIKPEDYKPYPLSVFDAPYYIQGQDK